MERSVVNEELERKDKEVHELRCLIKSLESRSARMKDYISRLTQKCEGWAESYHKLVSKCETSNHELNETKSKASLLEQELERVKKTLQNRDQVNLIDASRRFVFASVVSSNGSPLKWSFPRFFQFLLNAQRSGAPKLNPGSEIRNLLYHKSRS